MRYARQQHRGFRLNTNRQRYRAQPRPGHKLPFCIAAIFPYTNSANSYSTNSYSTRVQTMKWAAIFFFFLLISLYVIIGGFGFVMSAFCFDAGVEAAAWQCFTAINLIFLLPALICVIAGAVLLVRRRYKWSMVVAAIPAALAAVGLAVIFFANALY